MACNPGARTIAFDLLVTSEKQSTPKEGF